MSDEKNHQKFRCVRCGATWSTYRSFCTGCGGVKQIIPIPEEVPEASSTRRPPVMSAAQLRGQRLVAHWDLEPDWRTFMGRLPREWDAMVHGPPGSGKSTFTLLLADQMAKVGYGPILILATEEGHGDTLIERLTRLEVTHKNIMVSSAVSWLEMREDIQSTEPAAIIIDSFTAADMGIHHLIRLSEEGRPTIFTVHQTKGDQHAGDASLGHQVDVVVEVKDGIARTTKNRFAALGELQVFS